MGAFYAAFLRRQGFGPDVDRVRALWQAGERLRAVRAVSDDLLASCTLGTTPEEARHRLADYREEGIDLPILAIPHGATWQEADATVQGLVHAG
jgi:hypothetical protein